MHASPAASRLAALVALSYSFRAASAACDTPLINEIEANPVGADPPTALVELCGPRGATFTGVLLSIESDATSGMGARARAIASSDDQEMHVAALSLLCEPTRPQMMHG